MDHTKHFWNTIGKDNPHYGVLVSPEYSKNEINKNIDKYNESGKESLEFILNCAKKVDNEISLKDKVVLDFGSGTGRIAQHCSKICKKLFAVDIAQNYLNIVNSLNSCNIETVLYDDLINTCKDVDVVYSIIVIQHNPPSEIINILNKLCQVVNKNGILILHIPYENKQYENMNYRENDMEMHLLPKNEVYNTLKNNQVEIVDVIETDFCGPDWKNCVYICKKSQ